MYFNVILYWKCCSYNYTATVLYCTQMFFFFIIQYSIPSPPPLHFTFHHHYPLFPSPLAPTSLSYPFPPIQLLTHFTPLPSPLPLCNLPKGGGGGGCYWLVIEIPCYCCCYCYCYFVIKCDANYIRISQKTMTPAYLTPFPLSSLRTFVMPSSQWMGWSQAAKIWMNSGNISSASCP